MDVALIQWPADEELRQELVELGRPRLLLVDTDAEPPVCSDVLEDWVRLPVSREDRHARVRALETQMELESPLAPVLKGNGTLEYRGARTHLSAIQADLMRLLIARYEAVVSREALAGAWPEGEPTPNNLEVAVGRLRRQLEPIGLRIRTVRSRGYLLAAHPRR